MSDYSHEEEQQLKPFVSNLDKSVFVLKNLPQEVAGALFSRYSRSEKSVRRLLLDEFLSSEESGLRGLTAESVFDDSAVRTDKARDFFARILAGYGDDSIGELGGVHIAVEDISNMASKVLEDARIGLSPLEKSTRYVRFDTKVDGNYKYYREPEVMASKHADAYVKANDTLFDTYVALLEPMIRWVRATWPQDAGESDRAYTAMTKAKALDSLRGLLPASTLTNVGIFGNGRAFEYLLTKMYASDLAEMRELAGTIQGELDTTIPSLVSRANDEKYGQATQAFIRDGRAMKKELADKLTTGLSPEASRDPQITLVSYDEDAEERVIAAMAYEQSPHSLAQLHEGARKLATDEKLEIMQNLADLRGNRRQRPGRGFENTQYEFDFVVNYGAYRDLQRHRMVSQDRQWLSVLHGYDVPKQIVQAGFEEQFRQAMDQAADAYREISKDLPEQAQYVVPFGYRMRYRMTLNLRELYHLVELRSTPQGHPDYRYVAQEMYRRVKEVHPALVAAMKFVDLSNSDQLERRASERKIDQKLSSLTEEKRQK